MTTDPLEASPWSKPDTVAGFVASPPNATLLQIASDEVERIARLLPLEQPACRRCNHGNRLTKDENDFNYRLAVSRE